MYEVFLSGHARRFFESSDAPLQRKLDRCFDRLRADPRHHPNIKSLAGPLKGYWRYRVGDYRVVYRIEDDRRVVLVAIIAHRRQVYD